ncbi:MAG: aminotransferase class V-fold PLP-dependent enzyme, partial [Oscillospiraceae bacterium]|nr:aminotransferase class V-fold PLP-dependent enzyme [Oscillospiraceae bacterium]
SNEAGTLNVPGIAGLGAGIRFLARQSQETLQKNETLMLRRAAQGLERLAFPTYTGSGQVGVLSFRVPGMDCEEGAEAFARRGIALRAGLHCAPLAHRTGGTLPEGTIRLSLSSLSRPSDIEGFLRVAGEIRRR